MAINPTKLQPPKADRPGQAFQDLVATIERAISGQTGVTMETNVLVRDADGDLREHDILLTHTEGLRVTKTAVECKDRGRKIGKPDLEAFRSKCEDTGIHKGVIVSSSGFAESAMKASRRTNIQCLELAKVDTFGWVGDAVFIHTERQFSRVDIHVVALTKVAEPFRIYGDAGELLMANFVNVAHQAISEKKTLSEETREGGGSAEILWKPADVVYVIDANEVRHEVDHIKISTDFTLVDTPQDFELHSYRGDTGQLEIASTDFVAGDFGGKLMMVRDGENIRVMLQPTNAPQSINGQSVESPAE
ncbi:restriction endonuclease [Brevundimonas nasdae]|uniref:Restriction endonuclease n=1 Tax=Brevundimonas nasdae TaxID=172043 RepID=A0ACD4VKH5_9CAUL|nr:restriction endonuclease [Brevundimonas nasdae]WOB78473.1 restriction endonuclease [Brevundimonas nasdae]